MRCRIRVVTAIVAISLCHSARAVVIAYGTGTQNLTQPAGFSQWDNITSSGGGSAIYIDNGWVMQTVHQGGVPTHITFKGTQYTVDTASEKPLKNPDNLSQNSDARLYRLTTIPTDLTGLTLASSTPLTNTQVRLVGYGLHEPTGSSNRTYWDTNQLVNGVWKEVGQGESNASGYKWDTGGKRWGDNFIHGTAGQPGDLVTVNSGSGIGKMNVTLFLNSSGYSMAAAGDSGGGLFLLDGTLVGMTTVIFGQTNQPGSTAAFPVAGFADGTGSLDIASYRSQILAVVPEPSIVGLIGGLSALLVARRPSRKRIARLCS